MKFSLLIHVILIQAAAVALAEPVVPRGENVATESVPEIPLKLAEKVDRYGEYRTAQFMVWHPQRLEMLLLTRFGNTTQVHRVAEPGGRREQLTFFPDPVLNVTAWSQKAGKEFFTFSMDVDGDEFSQNFSFDPVTRTATLLTDGKKRNSGGIYSDVSGLLAYTRVDADADGALTEIRTVDPLDPATDRLVRKLRGGGWQLSDWSSGGKRLLLLEYLSINNSRIWQLDLKSGKTLRLAPAAATDKLIAHGSGKFAPQGDGVYYTSDESSEFRQLVHASTGQRRVIRQNAAWDVEELDVSPDGKYIAYSINAGGGSLLHVVESGTGKQVALPKIPPGVIGSPHWHNDSRHLAFSLTSASVPGDVFVVDVQRGKLQRWTTSESAVETSQFPEPEVIQWKSFDGRTISGFLYRPPARFTGKRPVIVNIHGGPESLTRRWYLGRMNYFLNEMGIAILSPNVRGSRGYGKSFLKLDNGLLREGTHKDISALIDWIGSHDELDARRIMIYGRSYGGYMTLSAAYRFSDRIACAVDTVGISNLRTFLENTQSYRRDLRRAEYGDERKPELRKWMDETSALENVDKIRKPLFVLQGANDPRVPQSESDQIVAAVKKTGTPVWYVLFHDEGHMFRKKSNADYAFYSIVLFTQKFLLAQ